MKLDKSSACRARALAQQILEREPVSCRELCRRLRSAGCHCGASFASKVIREYRTGRIAP